MCQNVNTECSNWSKRQSLDHITLTNQGQAANIRNLAARKSASIPHFNSYVIAYLMNVIIYIYRFGNDYRNITPDCCPFWTPFLQLGVLVLHWRKFKFPNPNAVLLNAKFV